MSGLFSTCSRVSATGKMDSLQFGCPSTPGGTSTLRPGSQWPMSTTKYRMIQVSSWK